jgi:large subunit ribosomal protein L9
MKVVLNTDLGRLGRKGDVVEVAGGYARNYLLPTNRAIVATKGAMKQAEAMKRSREQHEERERAAFAELAGRITASELRIAARAGAEGHLFGSVTNVDIAEALSKALGEDVDRRKIALSEPIKSLGTHGFRVHLHSEVIAEGSVEIVAEAATPGGNSKAQEG